MELNEVSGNIAKGLLQNPLIISLFIIGIVGIFIKVGIPIIKITKIELKQKKIKQNTKNTKNYN